MRYKLENGNLVPVTFIVTSEYVISNLTDEMIDSYKGTEGKILDESATPPIYNPDTQELKTIYIDDGNKIVKGYEVVDIIPSEGEKINRKVDNLVDIIIEMSTSV